MRYKIKNLFNFSKKIVVITGSSGQLGNKFCEFYKNNGAKVYCLDLNKSKKNHLFIKCDVSDEKQIKKAIEFIYNKEKKINIFINNAGVSTFANYKLRSKKTFMKIIEVNLLSAFLSINYYLKKLNFLTNLRL